MVRPVIIVGNLTVDDVIQADGSSQMGTLGGNSVHAAAAALIWTEEVGVVARCGTDFPAAALDRLREAGADTGGIRPIDGPTVRNWVIYEADGSRSGRAWLIYGWGPSPMPVSRRLLIPAGLSR